MNEHIKYWKFDNLVAYIPESDTGWVISVDISGVGDELKYSIYRTEPFNSEGWAECSLDEWLTAYEGLRNLVNNADSNI